MKKLFFLLLFTVLAHGCPTCYGQKLIDSGNLHDAAQALAAELPPYEST